jgi:uncharacterized protein (TIGR03435 family)
LKKADPTDRSSCKPDPGAVQGSKTPMQAYTCKNTTIAELAANIQQWAGGYIDHPVVDKTGLQGGWDFTVMWSPVQAIQGRPGPDGAAPAAVDPYGGITVFEAVEKQLGLKLEKGTNPVQVTVIDNLLEKPIE